MTTLIPDTTTLAEARDLILNSELLDPVLGLIKLGRAVRVRFLWVEGEEELPDAYTMGTFRALAISSRAKLVVDDGNGGLFSRSQVPELVE